MATVAAILVGFSIFEILLNSKRFCWKQLENIILYAKTMTYVEIYMNNYEYLIVFIQKIESLTANSIFHQLV